MAGASAEGLQPGLGAGSVRVPLPAHPSVAQVIDYSTYVDAYRLPTDADGTAGIQRALTAAGAGGHVVFQCHQYDLSATLHALPSQNLEGCGPNSTILFRTADYGDTLEIGSATQSAGAFSVTGIWFLHADFRYAPPATSLAHLATKGAHIHAWHGQGFTIANNWITRMPYGVISEGGTIALVEKNNISGIWDPRNVGAQEGLALIWLKANGNPTSWIIRGNNLTGLGYPNRTIAYTSRDPRTATTTTTQPVGSKTLVLADGCEDCDIDGGYIGGASLDNISLGQRPGTGLLDVRVHDVHFDSAGRDDIFVQTVAGTGRGLTISDNVFDSEGVTLHAVEIAASRDGASPSMTEVSLTGNVAFLYAASPFDLTGVRYATITGNTLTSFNSVGASTGGDPTYASGIFVGGVARFISIGSNTLCGNGGHTNYGYFVATNLRPPTTVAAVGNVDGGCLRALGN